MNEDSGLPETDLSISLPLEIQTQPVATTFAIFSE